MKKESYSTYEAKARFSELLRKVRRNRRIIITHRGKPVAELGPVSTGEMSLRERMARLEEQGVVEFSGVDLVEAFRPVAKSPGALRRFLEERD